MGESLGLRHRHFELPGQVQEELARAQKEVLAEVKKTWFFQYLVVEYFENGMIKKIERGLDWKGILSFGLVVFACGITIYVIGPATVVNAAKELFKSQGFTAITSATMQHT